MPSHQLLRAMFGLGLAATIGLAAGMPTARAEPAVLRHVPPADLKVLDPIANTAVITMEYAYLVYDQLFAVDANFRAQPQMVESYAVEDSGRSYRLTLRPGLTFSD